MHLPLLKGKIYTPALQAAIDETLQPGATDEIQETGQNELVSDPALCDLCTHRTVAMVKDPGNGQVCQYLHANIPKMQLPTPTYPAPQKATL